jgi:hypothetical protein
MEKTMEKPYKNTSDITLGMLLNHPYFRTLDKKDLANIINNLDMLNIYELLEGDRSLDKAENLINKTWKMETTKSERKIIGYKLIKPEYKNAINNILKMPMFEIGILTVDGDKICISDLKEAGVLDLWFEKVYEEEFKRGDKVILLDLSFINDNNNFTNGEIYTLGGIFFKDEDPRFYVEKNNHGHEDGHCNAVFRKATPEEIEKASTIEIGDCKVIFLPNSILIKTEYYDFYEIKTLVKLMKRGQIKSLNVGCNGQYKVDLELLTKILDKLEK